MSIDRRSPLISFCLLILLGWILGIFYGLLAELQAPGWFSIALCNTGAALIIWRSRAKLCPAARWRRLSSLWPAGLVLLGSTAAACLSRVLIEGAPAVRLDGDLRLVAFIIWIPCVEEIVFRLGLGGLARQRLGILWGAYTAALVFALAHGSGPYPSVPLGPLFLGLACEWLYVSSGQLSGAIALHAACNASAWIFAALDDRWLGWLRMLYLKV